MLLLRKAHLGEVTVWPKLLKDMPKNIHVLE